MAEKWKKTFVMGAFFRRISFMLIFIEMYGCTVIEEDVYISCEHIYADRMYKYSVNTNWTTDKVHSEEWDSEGNPLAYIAYSPFSRNLTTEVERVFSGNIYLKRCLNLTYSAIDDKFKEISINFIVTGRSEEEQYIASKVTSNLPYLAVLVPIIGLVSILGIEWKIGCLRRWFSRQGNGWRLATDGENMAEKDKETVC